MLMLNHNEYTIHSCAVKSDGTKGKQQGSHQMNFKSGILKYGN